MIILCIIGHTIWMAVETMVYTQTGDVLSQIVIKTDDTWTQIMNKRKPRLWSGHILVIEVETDLRLDTD